MKIINQNFQVNLLIIQKHLIFLKEKKIINKYLMINNNNYNNKNLNSLNKNLIFKL